jgi:ssDNA-binding Zn-finger/Zn-ribbon topoisomerase 1
MITSCPKCEHRLQSELGSLGAFRMVLYFDYEEESGTCAEQVERCPGCGLWLYAVAMNPSDLAQRS